MGTGMVPMPVAGDSDFTPASRCLDTAATLPPRQPEPSQIPPRKVNNCDGDTNPILVCSDR